MGLIASIYRSDYDAQCNAFYGFKGLTLVNVDGPFEPSPNRPAALLKRHTCFGDQPGRVMAIVVPAVLDDSGKWVEEPRWTMFGGAYCASSDGRFWDAVRAVTGQLFPNGALPIHDRIEG